MYVLIFALLSLVEFRWVWNWTDERGKEAGCGGFQRMYVYFFVFHPISSCPPHDATGFLWQEETFAVVVERQEMSVTKVLTMCQQETFAVVVSHKTCDLFFRPFICLPFSSSNKFNYYAFGKFQMNLGIFFCSSSADWMCYRQPRVSAANYDAISSVMCFSKKSIHEAPTGGCTW